MSSPELEEMVCLIGIETARNKAELERASRVKRDVKAENTPTFKPGQKPKTTDEALANQNKPTSSTQALFLAATGEKNLPVCVYNRIRGGAARASTVEARMIARFGVLINNPA